MSASGKFVANRRQRRAAHSKGGPVPRSLGIVVDLQLPTLDRVELGAALGAWKSEFAAASLAGRFVVIAGCPGVPGCLAMGLADEPNLEAAFVGVNETMGERYHADGLGVTAWVFLVETPVENRLRNAVAGQMVL